MAQEHGDRLTAVDASFLAQEGPTSHMHVGAVMIFEGPAPDFQALADHVRGRLHLVPRFRQKLAFPPLETGRPLWIDDPSFNLEYHVRDTALPSPGSEAQLRALAARVHSQALDRSKPLWEMWLVHGLEGGRFATVTKTHHALVDGVSGVDLATVLFDLTPTPAAVEHGDAAWTPQPAPSGVQMAARGVRGLIELPLTATARAVGAASRPGIALQETREALEGLGEVVWAGLNPAPSTPLNVEIGPHRRLVTVRQELAVLKEIKNALGGTVNDVVLTVVTGALQKWLRSRGVRTEGLELRALVPVSIRARDEHHQLGNRLAAMRAPLPVYVEDPVARLQVVRRAMDGLKESKQAVGAEVLAGMQALAPPTILAQASRLNFSTRLFNLLVTNVPGPQFPLYVLGRRLEDLFPVAFLPKGHALAVAVMSYDGGMDFGLLGDYDAMPDLDEVGALLAESAEELLGAAREAAAAATANGASSRARTSRPRTSSRASTEA
ncbi:MAG TPA: wax ester/triacylglycerol synthase family O-acyltransferase [Solirubrobacteraceae bacterium]|nr:wax ester/triacylglycerol synthase family O-acyltransferase [Solirubrobacteraceae bacterium]